MIRKLHKVIVAALAVPSPAPAAERLQILRDAGRVQQLDCDREAALELLDDLIEPDDLPSKIITQWASKIRVEGELRAAQPRSSEQAGSVDEWRNKYTDAHEALLESQEEVERLREALNLADERLRDLGDSFYGPVRTLIHQLLSEQWMGHNAG